MIVYFKVVICEHKNVSLNKNWHEKFTKNENGGFKKPQQLWPPLEAQVALSLAATVPAGVELGEYF